MKIVFLTAPMAGVLQDLRTNEARLQELNNIADRLTAMGQTEAAEKIREQIAVCI